METGKHTALVAGATGLTGSYLLPLLLDNEYYSEVIVLTRKKIDIQHPRLKQYIYNFDQPEASLVKADHIYCCLGTTKAQAGSPEAQKRVDYTYPLEIAQLALKNGAEKYILVSALGANAASSVFYMQLKGSLERDIASLGFVTFISLRPSVITGGRKQFRLGEKMAIILLRILGPLFWGGWVRYRLVNAKDIAKTMMKEALKDTKGNIYIESPDIKKTADAS